MREPSLNLWAKTEDVLPCLKKSLKEEWNRFLFYVFFRGRKHRSVFPFWSPGRLCLQEEEFLLSVKRFERLILNSKYRSGDEGANIYFKDCRPGRGGFASY